MPQTPYIFIGEKGHQSKIIKNKNNMSKTKE